LNYYVYYKLGEAQVPAVRSSIESLFGKIKRETGIEGRWMRRRDDPSTYMEVYEGVQDENAFEALLAREGAMLGVERRVERFVLCSNPT
jgi:hypothetical protein